MIPDTIVDRVADQSMDPRRRGAPESANRGMVLQTPVDFTEQAASSVNRKRLSQESAQRRLGIFDLTLERHERHPGLEAKCSRGPYRRAPKHPSARVQNGSNMIRSKANVEFTIGKGKRVERRRRVHTVGSVDIRQAGLI